MQQVSLDPEVLLGEAVKSRSDEQVELLNTRGKFRQDSSDRAVCTVPKWVTVLLADPNGRKEMAASLALVSKSRSSVASVAVLFDGESHLVSNVLRSYLSH